MRAFGDEHFISIATGKRQPISQAPSVASVITAADIKAMGATDLDQILEAVPGLHVSKAPRGYGPLYTVRGMYSESNPQVLVLINGIPITNVYVGDRSQVWGGMPVNNIARIEIIRGPGSAMYGADAFAGTVNILTKTAHDIAGTEFGGRSGSFNTHEGWILHGSRWNDVEFALSLELLKSDGSDEVIESDAQTPLDASFGTSASYAPGSINLRREIMDARLDVAHGNWRGRIGYQGRSDIGTGAGVAQALDPQGSNDSRRINTDLTFTKAVGVDWDVTAQASYFDTSAESDLILYPPNAFGGAFPDGLIGSPYVYERHTRLGASSFYNGFERHSLRLGLGYVHSDMYKIREFKNFDSNGIPLGEVRDVSNLPNEVFIRPNDREVLYIFMQDEWTITPNWTLTGGVRHDSYSDFGDTTNPRVALVWQTRSDLTTKFMYGRAFRAPAFNELYNINNPVALGNPNLKPETIDTYEIAFNYQYTRDFKAGLNVFQYDMKDILRFTPDPAPAPTVTAQNTGNRRGHGLEVEAIYDVNPRLRVFANYAFQKSVEEESDSDVANAPQHQIYVRTDWKLMQAWMLNAQITWIADRRRDITDPRSEVDDYLITDLVMRYQAGSRPWEVALAIRNIFDEDAREPSPAPGSIPNDLPLPGRHFFAEVRYHFD